MRLPAIALLLLSPGLALADDAKYPPVEEYLMPRQAEIALARSAAPKSVSQRATVKVLTKTGYEVASQGDNGAVCLVMRGWSGVSFAGETHGIAHDATIRAPICFDPLAAQTVLPYEELRTTLALKRTPPAVMAQEVVNAFATGKLPRLEGVAFAYMWSADQSLGPNGAWHPHMMIYAPYYKNSMLGGHAPDSGLPTVASDEGGPFALVVVAVDDKYAIESGVETTSTKHH